MTYNPEYARTYKQTPEYKAKAKAYRDRSEIKARDKARRSTLEYKARRRNRIREKNRLYHATPEGKAKDRLNHQRRWSDPAKRAHDLEYQRNYHLKNKERRNKLAASREEYKLSSIAGRLRPEICDICGKKTGKGIVFDHCHANGHFRGWICGKCNWIFGVVKDDVHYLRKLIAYLERTKNYISPQLTLPGI